MELSILAVMQNLYQNGAINSQLLVHHHSKFRNFTRIKENNAIGGGGSTAKTVLKNTPAKFQASLLRNAKYAASWRIPEKVIKLPALQIQQHQRASP